VQPVAHQPDRHRALQGVRKAEERALNALGLRISRLRQRVAHEDPREAPIQRERHTEAQRAAHPPLLALLERDELVAVGVTRVEQRGVPAGPPPGYLRSRVVRVEVVRVPAPLQPCPPRLSPTEQVRVLVSEEAGQPAPTADRSTEIDRAGLLLLHVEDGVDIAVLERLDVRSRHGRLEETQPRDRRGALEKLLRAVDVPGEYV